VEHVVTVKYDRKSIYRAQNWFVYRRLGFRPGMCFFAAWASYIICLLLLYLAGTQYRGLSLFSNVGLFVLLVCRASVMDWADSRGLFPTTVDQTVVFKFSDDGVEGLPGAISEMKWQVFGEVFKQKDAWLLLYDANSRYIMIPTTNLTPECMQFIEEKIGEAKRKGVV